MRNFSKAPKYYVTDITSNINMYSSYKVSQRIKETPHISLKNAT